MGVVLQKAGREITFCLWIWEEIERLPPNHIFYASEIIYSPAIFFDKDVITSRI